MKKIIYFFLILANNAMASQSTQPAPTSASASASSAQAEAPKKPAATAISPAKEVPEYEILLQVEGWTIHWKTPTLDTKVYDLATKAYNAHLSEKTDYRVTSQDISVYRYEYVKPGSRRSRPRIERGTTLKQLTNFVPGKSLLQVEYP